MAILPQKCPAQSLIYDNDPRFERRTEIHWVFLFLTGLAIIKKQRPGTAPGSMIEEVYTMQEVYDFLKACKTYYLATVEDGQARVRPFGTVDLFEGKLYIQTGKSKAVSKQMMADPKIELCAFDGKQWLRVAAVAVEDDRREPRVHMLDNYPHLKANYDPDDGNTQVFYLKDAVATFSSFTAPSREIRF